MAGRPPLYNSKFHPAWAFSLAIRGLTEDEIARSMNIGRRTLAYWKEQHPEFLQALKTGKEPADAQVERSLYERAIGYEVEETRVSVDSQGKPTKVEKVKKHVPGDVTAAMFWLQNRKPNEWRNVSKLVLSGQVNNGGEVDEELEKDPEARELLKQLFRRKCEMGATSQD